MTNVLIAVDDDHFGNLIADFVVDHNWKPDTKFRILSVIAWLPPESQVRTSKDLQDFVEEEKKSRKQLLERFVERLRAQKISPNFEFELKTLHGNVAEQILKEVESWPADFLLVGSHSRKGLNLFVMGSVSTALVNHAHCSVMVVREQHSVPQKEAMACH